MSNRFSNDYYIVLIHREKNSFGKSKLECVINLLGYCCISSEFDDQFPLSLVCCVRLIVTAGVLNCQGNLFLVIVIEQLQSYPISFYIFVVNVISKVT